MLPTARKRWDSRVPGTEQERFCQVEKVKYGKHFQRYAKVTLDAG